MSSILIVEDEESLADAMRFALEREGYDCTSIADGAKAIDHVRAFRPDLVLLDLMLPGLSGMDVCRGIRRMGDTPIIIVTAKDAEADKVLGLELGADDYVTKPTSMRELVARVRALLRRTGLPDSVTLPTKLVAGPVELDTERHEVRVRGKPVEFPPKEFSLLECLLRASGKLLTRETLIARVWGDDYYGDTRTLDVHVKRLRAKIEEDPRAPHHVVTVRGLGYRFEP